MYRVLTSCADLFGNVYGFSPGISGLCYIGLGLGFFTATFFGASYADKMYLRVSDTLTGTLTRHPDDLRSCQKRMVARASQSSGYQH